MADTSKNIIIGIFVLAAIVLLVWLVLFIRPTPGNSSQKIRVRFSNIEKIQEGTRVTFAGEPVGKVEKIINHFNGSSDPRESSGPMYFFELILGIDSHVYVYDTDEVTVRTTGLFGERIVAIVPRHAPPGVIPTRVTESTILYAQSEEAMDMVLSKLSNVATKMAPAFDKLSNFIDANADAIHHAVVTIDTSMEEVGRTFKSFNESSIITNIESAFQGIAAVMESIEGALKELEDEGVWSNAGKLMQNLTDASSDIVKTSGDIAKTTSDISVIAERLRQGKGTIGRLLNNDDLYLDVRSLLSKADTIMNDINHYGLLFQQNRRWQRERTKRANLLASLRSPKSFRSYFDSEVDQIRTSLSRVSVLIDEARCSAQGQNLICNPCFVQEFATLLRHVESLQEELESYNQVIVETQCR